MICRGRHFSLIPHAALLFAFLLAACGGQPSEKTSFTVGLVSNNPNGLKNVRGFVDGLAELGYIQGENVAYVSRDAPVKGDDLDEFLRDLVDTGVDLIFTAGTPTGTAAHRITKDSGIPVVFGVIADPLAAGVMTDLSRPGGNMTGVMLSANHARRLELFLETAPEVKRILVPYNPDDTAPSGAAAQIREAAGQLGVEIVETHVRSDAEVDTLLENFPGDVEAVFLVPDSVINPRISRLLEVALERRLPVSGPSTIQVEQGALMAYGFIHHEVGGQAARIADRILKGTDPGHIPVETAEFYLAVNLRTAEAIGLQVPYQVLQQAEVIIRE